MFTARYELNHQASFWLFLAVSSLLLTPLVLALCPAARPTASASRYTHSTDHNFRLILGSYRLTSLQVHTNFLPKTHKVQLSLAISTTTTQRRVGEDEVQLHAFQLCSRAYINAFRSLLYADYYHVCRMLG